MTPAAEADGIDLYTRRGEVFVTVTPGARVPEFAEARARLEAWPLAWRDVRGIVTALRLADGEPVVCGGIEPLHEAPDDAPFVLVLDRQRDALFAVPWAEPEAPAVESGAMRTAIRNAGTEHGVEDEAIERLAGGPWREPILVAHLGRVPFEAPSLEAARKQAAALLHAAPDQVALDVVSQERAGMFGRQKLVVVARRLRTDGRFEVRWSRGEVLVGVVAPKGAGVAVTAGDVKDALAEFGDLTFDDAALDALVTQPRGAFATVARLTPAVEPEPTSPVAVWLSEDRLCAYVVPWANDAKAPLSEEVARAALTAAGVVEGIDDAVLARLATEPFRAPAITARGVAPQHGRSATIEWVIKAGGRQGPRMTEEGSVDYRELSADTTLAPENVIARKTPMKAPGAAGRAVTGETLAPRAAADVDLARHAGTNVAMSADGAALIATAAGMLVVSGEKASVTAVRTITGDVDFKVGNVRFEGSVVIRGSVKPGFRIEATGAIDVSGGVESATLDAGGDVSVGAGITGEGSTVHAGGGVRAKYLESAEVDAKGAVTVASEIWRSSVSCDDIVRVEGRIVGGVVRGRRGVVAQTLGSPSGTATRVEAGMDRLPTEDEAAAPGYRAPVIVARKTAHPNLTVSIEGMRLLLDSDLGPTTFVVRDRNVEATPGAARL